MTTTERVNAYLESCDLRGATTVNAGKSLGMGRQTLRKRLLEENTSFITLLDAERKRRCKALLQINRRADVSLVCKWTGYTGSSSVTRAFKRWFNVTLQQHKAIQE